MLSQPVLAAGNHPWTAGCRSQAAGLRIAASYHGAQMPDRAAAGPTGHCPVTWDAVMAKARKTTWPSAPVPSASAAKSVWPVQRLNELVEFDFARTGQRQSPMSARPGRDLSATSIPRVAQIYPVGYCHHIPNR